MKVEKWIEENAENLKGKTIAITGSTGGLGRAVCRHLASLGANLILLDRNKNRSLSHVEALERDFGILAKSFIGDMAKIEAVEVLAQKLRNENIDYFIINAGAYSLPKKKLDQGFDQVFQINFISPYYLTKRILSRLKESQGKVVVVGSIAHKYSKTNETDIDFWNVKQPRKVYGNAKRFLMFALELLLEKHGVAYSIAHPGITPTNITSHYPKFVSALIKYPMKMIFTGPRNRA